MVGSLIYGSICRIKTSGARLIRKAIAVSLAAVLVSGTSIPAVAASPGDFTDIPDNWSKAAIEAAISNGLLVGSDNMVMPYNNLKRAEMAAIINRAFGAAQKGDISKFTDIDSGKWYAVEMAKAVKMSTFSGDGNFMRPEDPITRQEAFVVLARAFKLSADDYASLDKFSDKLQVADWAKPGIAALAAAGYVNGSDGMMNPAANISRAEFAQVMHNILKTYVKASGTYTTAADGNVMINVPDVTLKGITVRGDLIIGDGVGTGNVTLDGVKIEGRTVVRGGGKDSIHVINGSTITGTVVVDNVNNEVRIVTDQGTTVQKIEAGSKVVLEGSFGEVKVVGASSENTGIEIKGNIQVLSVEAKADVVLTSGTVTKVDVAQTAGGTTISTAQGSTIGSVVANSQASITGSGTVSSVEAKANNIKVDTLGTKVTAGQGVSGVTAGGKEVAGGTSSTSTSSATTSSGGSRGSSSSSSNALSSGYSGDYDITSTGTYGPDSGTATVSGSVYINAADVTLKNLTVSGSVYINSAGATLSDLSISGNLTFGAGIGNGDAYISNVTVQGTTYVNGGGSNSIHIQGTSILGIVEVDDKRSDKTEPINISAEGTGAIAVIKNVSTSSTVKITPVTDTIQYVVAADNSSTTYGDTANKAALMNKIIAKADSILDASVLGSTDADKYVSPALSNSSLTEGVIDTSGEYGIWALKYYLNPLDGVGGYQSEYDRLEAKLQSKGLDIDMINMRDNPGNFTATMYDKWLPGPGSQAPQLGVNQGMLNGIWNTYSRFIVLKKYETDGLGHVVASSGNTDLPAAQASFISVANTVYGKLEILQNESAVKEVTVFDMDGSHGLSAGDRIRIVFKRDLKPNDSTKGQVAVADQVYADTSTFGTGVSVVYDSAMLNFYGENFEAARCTITLGSSPDAGLLGGTITIPGGKFGSYVPAGFTEVRGQYGAYITNLQPLFDIVINIPPQLTIP